MAAREPLSHAEADRLTYRDPDFLSQFLRDDSRIRSRRQTGLSRCQQARLARAVKVARELALIPYPPNRRPLEVKGLTGPDGKALDPKGKRRRPRRSTR